MVNNFNARISAVISICMADRDYSSKAAKSKAVSDKRSYN
jgi:hypothetical protein